MTTPTFARLDRAVRVTVPAILVHYGRSTWARSIASRAPITDAASARGYVQALSSLLMLTDDINALNYAADATLHACTLAAGMREPQNGLSIDYYLGALDGCAERLGVAVTECAA